MKGTLKRLGDSFGFFHTDSGDVYVKRDDLQADPQNGDRYEFNAEKRGGRNPVAINLRFISRGEPIRDDARRGRDRPERNREGKASVTIKARADGEVREFPEGKFRVVPFSLEAKRGNGPYAGLTVKLFVDSEPVDQDFTTDGSGHTFFTAYIDPDAKHALIVAVIKEGDREIGVYSQEWVSKPTAEVAYAIKADAIDTDESWILIRTHTTRDGKGAKMSVTARTLRGIEVEGAGSGNQVKFETEGNGYGEKKVRLQKPGKVEVVFELSDHPSARAQVEIETKAPEVCDEIRVIEDFWSNGSTPVTIYTRRAGKPCADKLVAESESGEDEIVLEGIGHGRKVEFEIPKTGKRIVRMSFADPKHYLGKVVLRSKNCEEATASIYLRQPKPTSTAAPTT